jgi:hypothetical protein
MRKVLITVTLVVALGLILFLWKGALKWDRATAWAQA